MTLLEAIQNCGENLFRPIKSRGLGIAFSVDQDGYLYKHAFGKKLKKFEMTSHIIGAEWEIVTPEQVRGERG